MKVSSLMFIQQLLETEVEKEKKAVEKVKTLLAEKENAAGVQWNTPDNKVDDNIRFLRSAKATHRENLSKVEAVLEDFKGFVYENVVKTEYKTENKAVECAGSIKEGQCFILKHAFTGGRCKG